MIEVRPYKTLVVFVAQVVEDGKVKGEITLTNQGQPWEFFSADQIPAMETATVADAQTQLQAAQPVATEPQPLEKMTRNDLRDHAKTLGLKTSGSRAELIGRIRAQETAAP